MEISVSPPPTHWATGTGHGIWLSDWAAVVMGGLWRGRNVRPPSTERFQMLRCVPVPQGPLAYTAPSLALILTSGSPYACTGSTTAGLVKPIPPARGASRATAPAWGAPVSPRVRIAATAASQARGARGFLLDRPSTRFPPSWAQASGRVIPDRRSGGRHM